MEDDKDNSTRLWSHFGFNVVFFVKRVLKKYQSLFSIFPLTFVRPTKKIYQEWTTLRIGLDGNNSSGKKGSR